MRPENTPAAYRLAVEQRADMIEIDLHTTRDGVVVVSHDAELSGIGGRGEIGDATLEEIRALDAGDGQCVPTLDEVLDEFADKIPFNLELKRGSAGCYPGLEAAVIGALAKRNLSEQTLLSSFEDSVLRQLREFSGEARLAILISPRAPDRIFERAKQVRAEAINPHFLLVDQTLVDEAHRLGLAVYVFTVDEEKQMSELLALGVDGLFTNRPDRMREFVDSL